MPSRLIGGEELDGLLGRESPSKEVDSSCWGRKRKKKKNSLHEDTVSGDFKLVCACLFNMHASGASVDCFSFQKTFLRVLQTTQRKPHGLFVLHNYVKSDFYERFLPSRSLTKLCRCLFSGTVSGRSLASQSLPRVQRCFGTLQWLSPT